MSEPKFTAGRTVQVTAPSETYRKWQGHAVAVLRVADVIDHAHGWSYLVQSSWGAAAWMWESWLADPRVPSAATSISTVAELEALPVGTQVAYDGGETFLKLPNGNWEWKNEDYRGWPSLEFSELFGPSFTVLAASSPLHMTRCVADGCMTAHALPPGSAFACPEHTKHITLGRDS